MSDMIETVRERAHSKGFKEGVNSERLQTINLLGRIAQAPDVEAALHAEHEKLSALQAREVAALAATDVNARRVFSSPDEQLAFFERINTPGGSAPSGAVDNEALVAAAMGLTMPEKPVPTDTPPSAANAQPIDDQDKVARALGLL
jgi:hypothetical protein